MAAARTTPTGSAMQKKKASKPISTSMAPLLSLPISRMAAKSVDWCKLADMRMVNPGSLALAAALSVDNPP